MTQKATFDAQAAQNTKISQLVVPTFAANIWRSAWVNVSAYRALDVLVASDTPLAAAGVVLEQCARPAPSGDSDARYWTASNETGAPDGNVQQTHPITGVQDYRVVFTAERAGLFARLVVKHGGVEPTVFDATLIGAGIT